MESYESAISGSRLLPDSALTAYHVISTFNCGVPATALSVKLRQQLYYCMCQPGSEKWLAQAHRAPLLWQNRTGPLMR
jgi:hypothetical protein